MQAMQSIAAARTGAGEPPVADGFFVLRTPLLPAATLARFAASTAPPEDAALLEAWLADERARERRELRVLLARGDVREALFAASPSLFDSLEVWDAAADSSHGQAIEAAVFRYVQRMATRPTPFGLFAGITLGAIGDRTALALGPQASYRRHTRIDNDYLESVTRALAGDPALRATLAFEPNTSIYRAADRVRFIETRSSARGRSYVLAAVDRVAALDAVLAAASGGRRLAELAAAVTQDDPEIDLDEAVEFVDELVDAGLLQPTLAPCVTGPEPVHGIIAALGAHPAAATLRAAQAQLAVLDAGGIGRDRAAYQAIEATLRALPADDKPPSFQVDLAKPGDGTTLGGDVLAELVRAAALVLRINGGDHRGIADSFARAFTRRFEAEEVPLALALDPELGVGLGEPDDDDPTSVLAGEHFRSDEPPASPWSARDDQLLALLTAALASGRRVIELDDRAATALEADPIAPLPAAFCAQAVVHAASPEALDRGEFLLELAGLAGPSGANMFGRFCHGDRALSAWVERHLRAEESARPDAVFAEIVHWPEGHLGNVVARPVLRAHEIVFLGRGGAPPDHQLLLEDLLVSVRAGRVVLRSRRLGREVIPRMTNAHAATHRRNPGVYRLLGELAGHGALAGFGWRWGKLKAAFLPRVARGRIILSLARWQLTPEQAAAITLPATRVARFDAVRRLRGELGLPRHVALPHADQVLPVDLDSVLSVEALLHAVRGRRTIDLLEQLEARTGSAQGPEGGYRAELQVPMFIARPRPPAIAAPPIASPERDARVFPPGSEWLYLQLFAGISTLDRVVVRLAPVLEEQHALGHIDRWFFVRYNDPAWHLRLRLHGSPEALWTTVRGALQPVLDELVSEHGVHRIAYDTYRRELERYGGAAGMALAERIFHADSAIAATSVASLLGDELAEHRFALALTTVDVLLAALIPEVAARRAMIEATRDQLTIADLGDSVEVGRWLGNYARQHRRTLEAVGALDTPDDSLLHAPMKVVCTLQSALVELGAQLRNLAHAGQLTVPMTQLSQSLIHMHVNRMLRGEHRRQEAVIYDLLARIYRSREARHRRASPPV